MMVQRTLKPSRRLLRPAPSPLAGEGWGGGWPHLRSLAVEAPPGGGGGAAPPPPGGGANRWSAMTVATPLPNPPPQGGREPD
jgi:hypothetical protein